MFGLNQTLNMFGPDCVKTHRERERSVRRAIHLEMDNLVTERICRDGVGIGRVKLQFGNGLPGVVVRHWDPEIDFASIWRKVCDADRVFEMQGTLTGRR